MNKVYAIIGPPASGKTTIVRELRKHGVPVMVSHTTRPLKEGEQHGVDYYFVDKETFAGLHLAERASYSGNFYGLSKEEVQNKSAAAQASVVAMDLNGYGQLKKLLSQRLESIFILIDKETILNRYILLGESNARIKERIDYAEQNGEFDNWRIADYVVKNTGPLEVTMRQVLAILDLVIPKEKK